MNISFSSKTYECYLQIQRAITERRAWLIEMWLDCFKTNQLELCEEWSERIRNLNDGEIMLEKNVEFSY